MQTFWRVTLPQISPAIMAGFLLAFTFSFDDFIIAFFVAGSETTLPIYIFSSIRRGVTPEINAVSTVIICVSLACCSLPATCKTAAPRSRPCVISCTSTASGSARTWAAIWR
jgi:ABC-type spermidine/putrescine transport system permease subunit II